MPRLAGQQDLGRTASEDPRTPVGMDAENADWMQDHEDKVKQVNRNARINDLELQAMGDIRDLETEVVNDPNTNPATLEATFQARAERLRDRIAEAIKDPEVEQPFRDYYGHLSGRSRAKVASLARERMVADGLASLDRSLERYEDYYAGLTDADERRRVKDLVQRKIGDAIDTDLLTLDDGVRTFRTWEGDIDRAWLDRQVSDWAARQSGALAAQRGFATGRFGDAQIEEAWNRRDPEERKALATGVLKQLDAQRTARREAAEAVDAARRKEADGWIVDYLEEKDPAKRRDLAKILKDQRLDVEPLEDSFQDDREMGTGGDQSRWVTTALSRSILLGETAPRDILQSGELSRAEKRDLARLWRAVNDPRIAEQAAFIRDRFGVGGTALETDPARDAATREAGAAILELARKLDREPDADPWAIARALVNEGRQTLRDAERDRQQDEIRAKPVEDQAKRTALWAMARDRNVDPAPMETMTDADAWKYVINAKPKRKGWFYDAHKDIDRQRFIGQSEAPVDINARAPTSERTKAQFKAWLSLVPGFSQMQSIGDIINSYRDTDAKPAEATASLDEAFHDSDEHRYGDTNLYARDPGATAYLADTLEVPEAAIREWAPRFGLDPDFVLLFRDGVRGKLGTSADVEERMDALPPFAQKGSVTDKLKTLTENSTKKGLNTPEKRLDYLKDISGYMREAYRDK